MMSQYMKICHDSGKGYLILGPANSICSKNMFNKWKNSEMHLGLTVHGSGLKFNIPDELDKPKNNPQCNWYTNLKPNNGVEYNYTKPIENVFKDNKENYTTFNFKLNGNIEKILYIPTYKSIPEDYDGLMAVSRMSFLEKCSPNDFEVEGLHDVKLNGKTNKLLFFKNKQNIMKESIKEISNTTIGSAIRKAVNNGREQQPRNMAKMAVEKINNSLSFNANGYTFKVDAVRVNYTDYKFFVVATSDEGGQTLYFKNSERGFLVDRYNESIINTNVWFAIKDLKAGPRRKLSLMLQSIDDLNNEQNMVAESIDEKAKSKAQQRFFGMVRAVQKGDLDKSEVGQSVIDAAKSMKKKDVKDFAETKHKGLPEHKKKKVNEEIYYSSDGGKTDETDINNFLNFTNKYHDLPECTWFNDSDMSIKSVLMLYKDLLCKVSNAMSKESFKSAFHWYNNIEKYLSMDDKDKANYCYNESVKIAQNALEGRKIYSKLNEMFGIYEPVDNEYELEEVYQILENGQLNESVQSDVVKTMGEYVSGKCDSKKANKAIMKLASIKESQLRKIIRESLQKIVESEYDNSNIINKKLVGKLFVYHFSNNSGTTSFRIKSVLQQGENELVVYVEEKGSRSRYFVVHGNVNDMLYNPKSPRADFYVDDECVDADGHLWITDSMN